MNNYPNLGAMFDNGMNAMGAGYMGMQQADAEKAADLANRQQDLINQQTAAMNPLNQQYRQAEIDRQAAELPGLQGQSASSVAAGKTATENQPLSSQATSSKLQTGMSEDKAKQMALIGPQASTIGAQLASIPSVNTPAGNSRMIALQSLSKKYGMTLDDSDLAQLSKIDPQELPQHFKDLGENLTKSSGEYISKMAEIKQHTDSQERVASGNNQASRDVATINAGAKRDVANIRNITVAQKRSAEQQLVSLTQVPEEQRDASWQNQWNQTSDILAAARPQNDLAASVVAGQQAPTNADRAATLKKSGGATAAAPTGAPVVPAGHAYVGKGKDGSNVFTTDPANPKDQSKWVH